MTDLYAILPLGTDKRGRGVPLLKKKGRKREPGLTGGALEAAVDRWARNPLYGGAIRGATGRVN